MVKRRKRVCGYVQKRDGKKVRVKSYLRKRRKK